MKLNINARFVAAICEFKAKNDIRYYLNGVYVEPLPTGGAVIVATNGYVMGVWRDVSAIVERPAILRIGKKLREAFTECADGRLSLVADQLVVFAKKSEYYIQPNSEKDGNKLGWEIEYAKYPCWKKVFPDERQTGPQGTFNAKYIKPICKALKIAGGSLSTGIAMRQASEYEGIFVACSNQPDFAAIIMPMRDDKYGIYPAWINESKAPTKKSEPPLHEDQPSDASLVEC